MKEMKREIPQWVIEYNNAGHQSSAGKAIKILMEENERMAELLKEERKKAYDAIDKAYTELKKMGYDGDMNILAVMIKLQEQFK